MKSFGIALCASLVAIGCGGNTTSPAPSATPPATDTDSGAPAVDTAPPVPAFAQGLPITSIAIFQAVKINLVAAGAKVDARNAPVIAGRPGMLRVYVAPDDTWTPHEVEADLTLTNADGTTTALVDTKTIGSASTDADVSSTFNFDLAPEAIAASVSYSVTILDRSATAKPDDRTDARYPADGSTDDLGALTTAPTLKVHLVPLKYDFDHSGRVPDISPAQVQRYHDTLYKMYPAAQVEVTVGAPLPWSTEIGPDGTGWSDVMQAVYDQRATDNARKNVFYIGVFAPTKTVEEFCTSSCVLGLAPLVSSPNDHAEQIALIVGYSGQMGPNTLNQELAHAMGREHANCGGAAQPDRKYPYKGANIGVWGYDILKKTFIDPASKARDFMGYCEPIWISDYTYQGLFTRIANLDKGVPTARHAYRVAHLAGDGSLKVGSSVTLEEAPLGTALPLEIESAARVGAGVGRYFPYDNVPGGLVLVDEDALVGATAMRVADRDTRFTTLAR